MRGSKNTSTKQGQPYNVTDLDIINCSLRSNPVHWLSTWLPDGRVRGAEYLARNPRRKDQSLGSFSIKINGSKVGVWADFSTGDRGSNLISLYAYLLGLDHKTKDGYLVAARKLSNVMCLWARK
jgi:hypothetical protein